LTLGLRALNIKKELHNEKNRTDCANINYVDYEPVFALDQSGDMNKADDHYLFDKPISGERVRKNCISI